MFARALKSNVLISIAVLLFVGMVLIDFVVVRTFQGRALRAEIDHGKLFVSAIENSLLQPGSPPALPPLSALSRSVLSIYSGAHVSCLRIDTLENRPLLTLGGDCGLGESIQKNLSDSMASGRQKIEFSGTTWGVFWWQPQSLIITRPLEMDGRVFGGVGIARNLEGIYLELRRSQKYVFVYLFVNIVVLTFVGFHRLFKVFLEPIERLARRAENYQNTGDAFFPVRKQDNELQVLSSSLNSMTQRITEDKKKLEAAVQSLEKSNVELRKAQEEIIRAEKLASVGRLSSGIAHEIGNPIGIIMGYLELLKNEGLDPGDKQDYILRTEKELHRMDTVIRQLLDLSRPAVVDPGVVSVHEVVHDIIQILRVQPLMSNIDLRLELDAAVDRVHADPNQLRQIFLNLAINAADAMAAGNKETNRQLEISTSVRDAGSEDEGSATRNLEIRFADNGPGISGAVLDNIFDPFFTTKAPGKGTGLGLYVCFMIVDSMGGTIQAHSREGQGTTMIIRLPLAVEESSAEG